MKLRVLSRLIEIQRVLVRHGLDEFVRATHLYRPLRFLFLLSPWTWAVRRGDAPRAERLRLALEELGPIFVKFGQALSTRRDLLPVDIADELAKLQDRVPPFDGKVARAIIEAAYGRTAEQVFSAFEETPLAAASIAQVHAAELRPEVALNGAKTREVVVKVLRPGMHAIIARDLEVLRELAHFAERNWEGSRRLKPVEIVSEYEKTILDELDLMREAGNASQLRRNFEASPLLYVPAVHWDFCRHGVMVMERIRGVQISNMARLREAGTDIKKLAENGVDDLFYAGVPAQLLPCRHAPRQHLRAHRQSGAAQICRGGFRHRGHAGSARSVLPRRKFPGRSSIATTARLRNCISSRAGCRKGRASMRWNRQSVQVCEPIFNKPLKEISFGTVLLRLFEIARRFDVTIQPQLILLQKTLLNIEGWDATCIPISTSSRPPARSCVNGCARR
jgi:ubiquinone biosynthesis protein